MRIFVILSLTACCCIGITTANIGLGAAVEEKCVDKRSWCESMAKYCDLEDMGPHCPKTCKKCKDSSQPVIPSKRPEPGPGCETMICDHGCGAGKDGTSTCLCNQGYELQNDKRSCKDINECRRGNPCNDTDSECINTQGSYKCEKVCSKGERKYYGRKGCCELTNGQCGRNSVNSGKISSKNEKAPIVSRWPWMSFITVNSTSERCAGVLVSDSWVLAAAHCFRNSKPEDVHVYVGIINTNEDTGIIKGHSQGRRVEKVVIHPNYDYPSHDVALIKLTRKVDNTQYVSPVCLTNNEVPPRGQNCWATGYAAVPRMGRVTRWLQQETVEISDRTRCASSAKKLKLDENMLCIKHGKRTSPKDCQGSTGGPLVCQRCSSCDWYVAGIASEGISCAVDKTFTAFTSITVHENWVRETIGFRRLQARVGAACQHTGKTPQTVVEWANWGRWSECSVSCGEGRSVRSRSCKNGSPGEDGCTGKSKETKDCESSSCPGWQSWSEWSTCTKSCKGGTRLRTRKCVGGRPGNGSCRGSTKQSAKCNNQACPKWGRWGKWGSCSVTCGRGRQESKRTCVGGEAGDKGCNGKDTKSKSCKKPECPKWGKWSGWSDCSQTCGEGKRTSTRRCRLKNKTSKDCKGIYSRTESCMQKPCRACSDWSRWSICSTTCGDGIQQRNRECVKSSKTSHTNETRPCNAKRCRGSWTQWAEWTQCSATCGGGTSTRKRQCLAGLPDDCAGRSIMEKACNNIKCPSLWSVWGIWEPCNAACGAGKSTRRRNCDGDMCRGRPFEEKECFVQCAETVCSEVDDTVPLCELSAPWCSIQPDILWGRCDKTCCIEEYRQAVSEWSSWSTCTTSCGRGKQTRRRKCNLPHSCAKFNVNLEEVRECEITQCNARLTTTCSASCGGGFTQRPCRDQECNEDHELVLELCNTQKCPVKSSEWGEWGPCSTTCGVGIRERVKKCSRNQENCKNQVEVEECKSAECSWRWSEWQGWGPCTANCGLGTIRRNRTCLEGKCEGKSYEEEVCLTFECPLETSTCEDESSMVYLCPLLPHYCENDYMKYACRKTCGFC